MAGIYVHIPFCKKACHYCNFHFSTVLKGKGQIVKALLKEVQVSKKYLKGKKLETIYLGGGTPSLLSRDELFLLFKEIDICHPLSEDMEVTLEANPDDLTEEKIADLVDTPINRLSIGIQSFFDKDLEYMNRSHNAKEALNSIKLAQSYGFKDMSIDLIYGSPTTTNEMWQRNLDIAFDLGISHLSSYCLTVEEGTALHHFVQKGKAQPVDEKRAEEQFEMLQKTAQKYGYEHYEISNFALPNHYSRHNTAYWQGKHYLGIGPAAHSFNGVERRWNVANNAKYLKGIEAGTPVYETEVLTAADRYNEYVMTSLRTQWGCNISLVDAAFTSYFLEKIQPYIDSQKIVQKGQYYIIVPSARFLSDGIAADLFWVD